MNELDEVRLRLRISKLEAKIALAEIELTACWREIRSPLTPADRYEEVTAQRDHFVAQASALRAELDALCRSYPNLARH